MIHPNDLLAKYLNQFTPLELGMLLYDHAVSLYDGGGWRGDLLRQATQSQQRRNQLEGLLAAGDPAAYDRYRAEYRQALERLEPAARLRLLPQDALPRQPYLDLPGGRFNYNRHFVGREQIIRQLLRRMADPQAPVPVVHGIGGLGKSQLVNRVLYHVGLYFAGGVVWLHVDRPEKLLSELARAGAALKLPGYEALSPQQQAHQALQQWREQHVLLIFDDCPLKLKAALQKDVWPMLRQPGCCRIIATSRVAQWDGPVAEPLSLESLHPAESVTLLQHHQPDLPAETAQQIAAELGHHPLGLQVAGSYLAYRPQRMADFVESLRKKRLQHRAFLNPKGVSMTDHELSLQVTFEQSYHLLDPTTELDALAQRLFWRLSHLAWNEPISWWLVEQIAKPPLPEGDALAGGEGEQTSLPVGGIEGGQTSLPVGGIEGGQLDPDDLDDAVDRLWQLGLIDRDRATGSLQLHPLLGLFGQGLCGADDTPRQAVAQAMLNRVEKAEMDANPFALQPWLPHLRRVTDEALRLAHAPQAAEEVVTPAASLANAVGYLLDSQGDYAGARGYYEQALAIRRSVLGEQHPDTASSLNNLGAVLDSQGEYAGARGYYEQALAIRRSVLGEQHPDTAQSLNNMGYLLQAQGDYAGARGYYEQALAIRRSVLGEQHPDTALSLNNMGYLLDSQGDYAGARGYYEQALAIYREVLGEQHPDTARSLNNLGGVLDSQGDYAGARGYYEQALAIRRSVLGEQHPATALSLNNLGGVLDSQGDYAGARGYYEQALAIYREVLGEQHPDTARSLNNLGYVMQAQGEYAGARGYYEQALAIRRSVLGEQHPDTAQSLNNMGYLLDSQGDYAGARGYYEQALAIYRSVLGEQHPDTARSLNNLGMLLQAQGDYAGARGYYEQALAIKREVLGEQHPATALSLNNLGGVLDSQGDYAGARGYYEQALAIYREVLGEQHPDTARSLNNLGYVMQAQGEYAGARGYYEQALAIRRSVLGEQHPDTAQSLNNMGYLLDSQGDYAGARGYYEQALAIFKARLGPEHPHTKVVWNNLAAILAKLAEDGAFKGEGW